MRRVTHAVYFLGAAVALGMGFRQGWARRRVSACAPSGEAKCVRPRRGGGFKALVDMACQHTRGTSDALGVCCMGAARVA